ncbi:MAG: ATP-binding protein [Acetobacteraceae bacterium]|nr:ATP-binding protein [Acetobacteraceae bacterium]
MPADLFSRAIPLQAAELSAAQEALARFLEGHGVAPIVTQRVALVVEELVANLIHHARFEGPPPPARLTAAFGTAEIRLRLEDAAAPFDPRERPDPALPPDPVRDFQGGLGLPLVRRMAELRSYGPAPDGWNRLELAVPNRRELAPDSVT